MNTDMSPQEVVDLTRRDFLATGTTGLGTLALASLLQKDGLLAPSAHAAPRTDPLAPKRTHFTPKAKNCILIYFEGAPSHVDLFDPKPKLNEMDGEALPESMLEKVRYAAWHSVLWCRWHRYRQVPTTACHRSMNEPVPVPGIRQSASCADHLSWN